MMEKFHWKEQSDHTLRNKDITPANHLVANNNLFSNENETFFFQVEAKLKIRMSEKIDPWWKSIYHQIRAYRCTKSNGSLCENEAKTALMHWSYFHYYYCYHHLQFQSHFRQLIEGKQHNQKLFYYVLSCCVEITTLKNYKKSHFTTFTKIII